MDVFPAHYPRFLWMGRTFEDNGGSRYLVGSASSLRFRFYGSKCLVWVQNLAPKGQYNYITIIVDGIRQPRKAIRNVAPASMEIVIPSESEFHDVEIYKETEAMNGSIVISSIETEEVGEFPWQNRKTIEFIGNSITVGMGADASLIPCLAGTAFDQHNVYDAYGPRVARALDMHYFVTGVSGMGMYRNWNTDAPVMNDVYGSVFLSPDPSSPRWNFNELVPDIISICLGTNDLSDGDGVSPRSPFNQDSFVEAYLLFLERLHSYYPDVQIVITNTPLVEEDKNKILMSCLEEIKAKSVERIPEMKPVQLFSFSRFEGTGCGGHPSVEEHRKMAEEMIEFLREHVK